MPVGVRHNKRPRDHLDDAVEALDARQPRA